MDVKWWKRVLNTQTEITRFGQLTVSHSPNKIGNNENGQKTAFQMENEIENGWKNVETGVQIVTKTVKTALMQTAQKRRYKLELRSKIIKTAQNGKRSLNESGEEYEGAEITEDDLLEEPDVTSVMFRWKKKLKRT